MGDASLVEMVVVKVSPYLREDRPLLWLGEKEADCPRLLPIAIGEFEAAAIQMQLEGEEPIRPISYDLLSSMLDKLAVDVRQVVIHAVRKSIYYAKVVIAKDRKIRDIDSRPSDAVALALRTGTPIYVSCDLLDQVGLEPLEDEMDIEHTLDRFHEFEPQISERNEVQVPSRQRFSRLSVAKEEGKTLASASESDIRSAGPTSGKTDQLSLLQSKLEQAVICEEYEEAARLRDEIESLINKNKS